MDPLPETSHDLVRASEDRLRELLRLLDRAREDPGEGPRARQLSRPNPDVWSAWDS